MWWFIFSKYGIFQQHKRIPGNVGLPSVKEFGMGGEKSLKGNVFKHSGRKDRCAACPRESTTVDRKIVVSLLTVTLKHKMDLFLQ